MQDDSGTGFIYGFGANVLLTDNFFLGGSMTFGPLKDTDVAEDEGETDEDFFQGVFHVGYKF